jgi:hypothetical protein
MVTTNINTIRLWIGEVNDWPSHFSGDKLVYDIGNAKNLEVHRGYNIDVDGKPMQIPACVGLSGDAKFQCFRCKTELLRILGAL